MVWVSRMVRVNQLVSSSGPSICSLKSLSASICSCWSIGGISSSAAMRAVLNDSTTSASGSMPRPETTLPSPKRNQRPTELSAVFIWAVKLTSPRRSRKAW